VEQAITMTWRAHELRSLGYRVEAAPAPSGNLL
jgi:hypothetical protein